MEEWNTYSSLIYLIQSSHDTMKLILFSIIYWIIFFVGRKTLRWSGVMTSDTMFSNMYEQYYEHEHNRWASFVIDDVLEEVRLLADWLTDNLCKDFFTYSIPFSSCLILMHTVTSITSHTHTHTQTVAGEHCNHRARVPQYEYRQRFRRNLKSAESSL